MRFLSPLLVSRALFVSLLELSTGEKGRRRRSFVTTTTRHHVVVVFERGDERRGHHADRAPSV